MTFKNKFKKIGERRTIFKKDKKARGKKAQIWVSGVLYLLIATAVVALVLSAGLPLMKKMREKATYNDAVNTMRDLDHEIKEVVQEGEGSQKVLPLVVKDGELMIKNDKIMWKLKTESKLLELNSKVDLGDLVIATDVDVSAKDNGTHFILSNSRIDFAVKKIGSKDNYSYINTSQLISYVRLKSNNVTLPGKFKFMLLNDPSTMIGNGYTELLNSGSDLPSATVRVHVNSSKYEYTLLITLLSKADFWKLSLADVRVK